MSQEVKPTTIVKKRTRRSPEMIAQLVWEAERTSNVAEIEYPTASSLLVVYFECHRRL